MFLCTESEHPSLGKRNASPEGLCGGGRDGRVKVGAGLSHPGARGVSEALFGFWYKPTAAGMHSCTRDLETMPRIVRRDVCPRVAFGRVGRGRSVRSGGAAHRHGRHRRRGVIGDGAMHPHTAGKGEACTALLMCGAASAF